MLPHDCYALMRMVHAGAHSHLFVCVYIPAVTVLLLVMIVTRDAAIMRA